MEPLLSDDEQKVWDILNAPVPKTPKEQIDELKAAMDAWSKNPIRVKQFMDSFKKRMDRQSWKKT